MEHAAGPDGGAGADADGVEVAAEDGAVEDGDLICEFSEKEGRRVEVDKVPFFRDRAPPPSINSLPSSSTPFAPQVFFNTHLVIEVHVAHEHGVGRDPRVRAERGDAVAEHDELALPAEGLVGDVRRRRRRWSGIGRRRQRRRREEGSACCCCSGCAFCPARARRDAGRARSCCGREELGGSAAHGSGRGMKKSWKKKRASTRSRRLEKMTSRLCDLDLLRPGRKKKTKTDGPLAVAADGEDQVFSAPPCVFGP